MANEEMVDWEALPDAQGKRNGSTGQQLLKFLAAVLLVGFCFHFLFTEFILWEPDSTKAGCTLFQGEWIPDNKGPAYTNETCHFIEPYQNCMRNERPDTGYLYWRWKPKNCDLPRFEADKFLNAMRNKSWALIGDSIFRNHMQSLICLLSKIDEPVDIYHEMNFKTRTWYFSSYNFTLAVIWAPFLVRYDTFGDHNTLAEPNLELHLDILDTKWTTEYHKYDYIVISGGQWFYKSAIMWENNRVIGCHNCPDDNLKELGVTEPYRKALRLAFHFVSTNDHKPFVVFRTWTPDHFEYGKWYNGGVCNRTQPYKEGEYDGDPTDHAMRRAEIEEFEHAAKIGVKNGMQMKLLDTYHLSLLRPDGHPGPYRTFPPINDKNKKVQNDCLHWCLPGPIDTWNELLMKMVIDDDDNLGHASA
ncbi:PC-Esterase protein [Dioscorea alata]|uniref:PC-Esterase protein n=1 Tax=Dioscorea alata TaxID=55571 RepID=A0ACB7TRB3_DIOAL|nr:PC-Esterase protein [Dioscorea alata]